MRLIDGKNNASKVYYWSSFGYARNVFAGEPTMEFHPKKEASWPSVLCLVVCLSWSYGSIFVSKADLPKNFFVSTGYQMLTAGVLVLLSISFGLQEALGLHPLHWSLNAQLSMIGLILIWRNSCIYLL